MIYYFDGNGMITRRAFIPHDEASLSAVPGEQWIQSDAVVSDVDYFVFNGALTQFPERPSQDYEWSWPELAWRLTESAFLAALASKKQGIDAERDRARCSGVTYNGHRFDSDPVSAGNVTGWAAAVTAGIPVPAGFTWRSADNLDIPFSQGDILGLAAAMVAKTTACYQRAWQLKALVDQVTSLDDYPLLAGIDIMADWPT